MKERDYCQEYLNEQIKAVTKPLKEVKESFKKELIILKQICKNKKVLDVGCGTGRPADKLAKYCKEVVCIDNNKEVLKIAKKNTKNEKNVSLLNMDAFNLDFNDNSFDVVFAAYNLIGSIDSKEKLVKEMLRVLKKKGDILLFTWKRDKKTTIFLKKCYSYLGFKVIKANENKTILDRATFDRVDLKKIKSLLERFSCTDIKIKSIGPVWSLIIAKK